MLGFTEMSCSTASQSYAPAGRGRRRELPERVSQPLLTPLNDFQSTAARITIAIPTIGRRVIIFVNSGGWSSGRTSGP